MLGDARFLYEAAFLRANDTVELYGVTPEGKFKLLTKYELDNTKCLEMKTLYLPWAHKDALVLYLPRDKVNSSYILIVMRSRF